MKPKLWRFLYYKYFGGPQYPRCTTEVPELNVNVDEYKLQRLVLALQAENKDLLQYIDNIERELREHYTFCKLNLSYEKPVKGKHDLRS